MIYTVDQPRAEVVLGKIWERYASGQYPYKHAFTMLPQQFIPSSLKRCGAEEAWYWMVVCLWMRGGVNSTDAAKQLGVLYEYLAPRRCRNPFNVRDAAQLQPKRIVELLTRVSLGMHQSAPGWIENAQRLIDRWDGNVLNILDGVTDFEEAKRRLHQSNGDGFIGFRSKMVSMLLYFLMEENLITPFPFPPPVDFHLQRVAIATGILRRSDGDLLIAKSDREFEAIQALLRDLYLDYQLRHGLDGNRFADALWILSRTLRRRNPGNRTLQIGSYNARSTVQIAYEPDWN